MKRIDSLLYSIFMTLVLVIGILPGTSLAKNLGQYGETYSITERDLLDFINTRIRNMEANGEMNQLLQAMRGEANQYRERPNGVSPLLPASETKSWLFDPTIYLDHDIYDASGNIVARSNTRINPLETVSLSKTLIFYDADNEKQVAWAVNVDRSLQGKDKLILVNGSILTEEKRFKRPIYFDQAGRLIKHFGITHLPAEIHQEGKRLKITEVKL